MPHPFAGRPDFETLSDDLFGFGTGTELDTRTLHALRTAARAIPDQPPADDSTWPGYLPLYAAPLHTLRHGTDAEIQHLVSNLFASPLTHGFAQGQLVTDDLRARLAARLHVGAITLDRFCRLAEATGAARLRSPEHGQRTIAVTDPDEIMARIEDRIGAPLPPTQQSGAVFGLRIRGAVYSERHFDAIYAAWRLRDLARHNDIPHPTLLEIGGGAGFLAFYALQLGFRQAAILDLPHTALTQLCVLATELGPDQVAFGPAPHGGPDTRIRLLRPADAPDFAPWSVVANMDGLPEMPPATAAAYLSRLVPGQPFLSINQESAIPNGSHNQNVVAALAAHANLSRRYRFPAWLRTGYVEELFTRPTP